jgi:hypothetical protein
MSRERALRILLVLMGLASLVGVYPLTLSLLGLTRITPPEEMILAIYVPMGVFLLMAVPRPSAHRTLIACVGWSNLLHAAVMLVQSFQNRGEPAQLPFSAALAIVAAGLVLLTPVRQAGGPSAVGATRAPPDAVRAGEPR